MKKIIAGIVAAVYALMLSVAPVVAPDVTASVTVETVCGLLVTSPDPPTLTFTSSGSPVLQGSTSDTESVTIDVDANALTTVDLEGTDWTGTGISPPSFGVGNTEYDTSVTPGFIPMPSPEGTSTPIFTPSADLLEVIGFHVNIPNPQAADTYTQTLTFTVSCDGG